MHRLYAFVCRARQSRVPLHSHVPSLSFKTIAHAFRHPASPQEANPLRAGLEALQARGKDGELHGLGVLQDQETSHRPCCCGLAPCKKINQGCLTLFTHVICQIRMARGTMGKDGLRSLSFNLPGECQDVAYRFMTVQGRSTANSGPQFSLYHCATLTSALSTTDLRDGLVWWQNGTGGEGLGVSRTCRYLHSGALLRGKPAYLFSASGFGSSCQSQCHFWGRSIQVSG